MNVNVLMEELKHWSVCTSQWGNVVEGYLTGCKIGGREEGKFISAITSSCTL